MQAAGMPSLSDNGLGGLTFCHRSPRTKPLVPELGGFSLGQFYLFVFGAITTWTRRPSSDGTGASSVIVLP